MWRLTAMLCITAACIKQPCCSATATSEDLDKTSHCRCHAYAGRMEQAAAAHQQALAADPSWVPAAMALAQALGSLSEPEQAVGVLQQAQQQLSGRELEAGALQSADIQVSQIAAI